ncbi:MAG: META domain-containing protein [Rikenellaceae bacterium]|nr:META domain-containing protein [Rikenellaceae bacterium]
MRKVIFSIAAASLALLAMASCNDSNSNYKALISNEWVLESIVDHEREAVLSVPDDVYIVFADSSRVYGNAGCNTFNGFYETEAYNQIGLSRLATTQMWCFNMDFETDYLYRLEKVTTYEATAEKLELTGTGNSFTLHYRSSVNSSPRNR